MDGSAGKVLEQQSGQYRQVLADRRRRGLQGGPISSGHLRW